jgi:hypothetical protein
VTAGDEAFELLRGALGECASALLSPAVPSTQCETFGVSLPSWITQVAPVSAPSS